MKRFQNKHILSTSYWNAVGKVPVIKLNLSSKDFRTTLDILSFGIRHTNREMLIYNGLRPKKTNVRR